MKRNKNVTIISGGQTGADRAAFDFALENDISIGGFVPKNRLAEDGEIAGKYPNLSETSSADPSERTELNVRHSDATLIVSHGALRGGSLLTKLLAEKYRKPLLHIDFSRRPAKEAAGEAARWLARHDCEKLNVAGPRASEDRLIYDRTREFLRLLFDAQGRAKRK